MLATDTKSPEVLKGNGVAQHLASLSMRRLAGRKRVSGGGNLNGSLSKAL